MKISKVDHTRMAVAKGNQHRRDEISGILYKDPTKTGSIDFDERFKKLNCSAKILYHVFNGIAEGSNKYKNIVDKVNNNLDRVLFTGKSYDRKSIIDIDTVLRNVEKINAFDRISTEEREQIIDDLLEIQLRKGLRKGKAGLREVLLIGAGVIVRTDKKQEIADFLEILDEDFNKTNQAKNIKLSIENQGLVVSPVSRGEERIFDVSGAQKGKSSKKAQEKEALSAFLLDYADLDKNVRFEYLRKIRRLINLYFYVKNDDVMSLTEIPAEVNLEKDFDIWRDHEQRKEENGDFVGCPDILLADRDVKKSNSKQVKIAERQLRESIREKNIKRYRFSIKTIEKDDGTYFFANKQISVFWIHRIENAVERILGSINDKKLYRLRLGYLGEKVWKDILNFLSIKYIAVGKAVFNFAMDDLQEKDRDIEPGKISENAVNGLTSFDYEQIKADEMLQREVAVNVAFAANNLARVTVDIPQNGEKEDILLWNKSDIKKYKKNSKKGILKSILQFFGGASTWNMKMFEIAYHDQPGDYEENYLYDIIQIIYSLRNKSFHFKTYDHGDKNWNRELIGKMIEHDAERVISVEREKFHSNNLPMFYKDADLKKILDLLYSDYAGRASQVPAFNTVLVRKNFPEFLRKDMGYKVHFNNPEVENQWHSAVYYLYKEIYYNLFLRDKEVKNLFYTSLKNIRSEVSDKKQKLASDDFASRCEEIEDRSLPEICQIIMTEYNAQNFGNRKVKSQRVIEKNKDIFRHYKMLLIKTLAGAFSLYLKQERFAFIGKATPIPYETTDVKNFLPEWKSGMYASFVEEIKNNLDLQEWYIVGRFLNGRMLNQLAGSLRSYIQYAEDIERRAAENRNKLFSKPDEKIEACKKAVRVLDLCIKISTRISAEFTDYFDSEDDYADYLEKYLKYQDDAIKELSGSSYAALDHFCNKDDLKFDIYVNAGQKPILQRNIVMAKLFGPDNILSEVMEKVTESAIREYYDYLKKVSGYRVRGKCSTEKEQEDLLKFQRLKNAVEFRDVTEYAEVINELLGQLISWSYLRERDLLYFQLGFHYMCLKNKSFKPAEYVDIRRNNGTIIHNAILYQIVSMYINGLDFYSCDKEGKTLKPIETGKGVGSKIGQFIKYSQYLYNDPSYKLEIYNAGLEVFENIDEHDNITDLRKYVDHFKYYAYGNKMSLLDLYSEFFDRFFTYDMKYQKNVVNVLENILLRHFVIFYPKFGSGKKDVGIRDCKKERAQIEISEQSLTSEDFMFKLDDKAGEEAKKFPARDERYLQTIAKLLYYPNEIEDMNRFMKKGETINKKVQFNRKKKITRKQKNNSSNEVLSSTMGYLFKNIKL